MSPSGGARFGYFDRPNTNILHKIYNSSSKFEYRTRFVVPRRHGMDLILHDRQDVQDSFPYWRRVLPAGLRLSPLVSAEL